MTQVAPDVEMEQNIAAADSQIDSDDHKEIRKGMMQTVQRAHMWPTSLFRWITFLAPFRNRKWFLGEAEYERYVSAFVGVRPRLSRGIAKARKIIIEGRISMRTDRSW
jgi:hypothetical protein